MFAFGVSGSADSSSGTGEPKQKANDVPRRRHVNSAEPSRRRVKRMATLEGLAALLELRKATPPDQKTAREHPVRHRCDLQYNAAADF